MKSSTPLKQILKADGLSQRWLGQVTGIAEADMSRIANRGMHPTQDEAQRIADALGRQVSEVFPQLADECAA